MLLFEEDEFEVIRQVTEPDKTVRWRRASGPAFPGTVQPFYSSNQMATLGPDYSTNWCFLLTSNPPPVKTKDLIRSKTYGHVYSVVSKPEMSEYSHMPGPDLTYYQTKVDRLDYNVTDDQL